MALCTSEDAKRISKKVSKRYLLMEERPMFLTNIKPRFITYHGTTGIMGFDANPWWISIQIAALKCESETLRMV